MPRSEFNVEGLSFEIKDPKSIRSYREWLDLKKVAEIAFCKSLPDRSVEAVRHMLGAASVDAFEQSRRYPTRTTRQSDHMRSSWFYSPTIAIASNGNGPIGYTYAAHNISGSPLAVVGKRFLGRSYINFREMAVLPEYQGRGVAEILGYLTLSRQGDALPATAYVYDESEGVGAALIGLGFDEYTDPETGFDAPEEVMAFGEYAEPAVMRRFQGNIYDIKLNILSRNGASQAIDHVLRSAA